MSSDAIIQTVKNLVSKYGSSNPFSLAESLNIQVHKMYLHEDISGFYTYERKNKFIIINLNNEPHYYDFVCAHELGHAILHPKTNYTFLKKHTLFPLGKYENEANLFAVTLQRLTHDTPSNDYLCETAEEYCIKCSIPMSMSKFLTDS